VLTAVVSIPLLLGVAWAGGWVFAGSIAVVAGIAAGEYAKLAERRGTKVPIGWVVLASAAFPLVTQHYGQAPWAVFVASIMAILAVRGMSARAPASIAPGLVGFLYVGGALAHLVLLRRLPQGHHAVLLVFFLTWACDTGAYGVGSMWGRRRPWPTLSPSKSAEGAAAGLVAPIIVAVALRGWLLPHASPWEAAGLGGLIGVVAQIGDLVESGWKREAGVKDSSGVLPGHGGFLDRFDSMMWSAPFTYYVITAFQLH